MNSLDKIHGMAYKFAPNFFATFFIIKADES